MQEYYLDENLTESVWEILDNNIENIEKWYRIADYLRKRNSRVNE